MSSSRNKAILAGLLLAMSVGLLGYRLLPYAQEAKQWVRALPEDKTERLIQQLAQRRAGTVALPSVSSPREEQERALFLHLSRSRHADVVVLPFPAPQAVSLDRTARTLMMYRLANGLAARSDLKVADPGLVLRALGAQRRVHEPDRVDTLLKLLGAKWAIHVEITRPVAAIPEDTPLVYSLTVRCAPPGQLASAAPIVIRDVAFADDFPPEEAFREHLDRILEQLPFGPLKPRPALALAKPLSGKLPSEPFALVTQPPHSALEDALRLQLLASFHASTGAHRDMLWERSILTLDPLDANSPEYAVLRARAYHHLGRRPYALRLLATQASSTTDPAQRALRALLDGNLPAQAQAAEQTADPALHLIAAIEEEQVRTDYLKHAGYEERRLQLVQRWPQYGPLVWLKLSSHDWANPEIAPMIGEHLAQLRMPVAWAGNQWTDQVELLVQRLLHISRAQDYDLLPASAVEQAFATLWRSDLERLVGAGLGPELTAYDYFELLQDLNRDAALKGVRMVCCVQARPAPGHALVQQLNEAIPADASVALTEAEVLYALVRQSSTPDWNSPQAEQGARLTRDAYLWEGGEGVVASRAEGQMWRKSFIKYLDEPVSRSRGWSEEQTAQIASTPDAVFARWLQRNLRDLAFTDTHARLLSYVEANLTALGRGAEFDAIAQQNAHRFDGSRTRIDLAARLARSQGNLALEERLRKDAIAASPDDWDGYWKLGWLYLERRDPAAAQRTFLAYPAFQAQAEPDHPVELGNTAGQAAEALLGTGERELAQPLLEICSALRTGSGMQMRCDEALSRMAGDRASAAAHARSNLERYPSTGAANAYIQQLFVNGHTDEAWKAFDYWSARQMEDELQEAAAFGDRLLGRSDQEIVEAARRWNVREDLAARQDWQRDERMFMALFLDREVSEQTLALFDANVKGEVAKLYSDLARGYVAFANRDYRAALEAWRPVDAYLTEKSYKRGEARNFLVPYLAVAYLVTGDDGTGMARLEAYRKRFPRMSETTLLDAITTASKDPARAKDVFWTAFLYAGASSSWRPLDGRLSVLEVLEALLDHTHDARYRELIVEYAQRQARYQASAGYAYAFEAKYAQTREQRTAALAYALYLDRRSRHLSQFDAAQKREALAWWEAHRPMGTAQ